MSSMSLHTLSAAVSQRLGSMPFSNLDEASVLLGGIKIDSRNIAACAVRLAQKYGTTMTAVSLAWHFAKGVASPVIGATKTAYLDDAVAAFAVSLTAEDVALIDEFYLPHKVMGALAP